MSSYQFRCMLLYFYLKTIWLFCVQISPTVCSVSPEDLNIGDVGSESAVPETFQVEASSVDGIRPGGGCVQISPTECSVSSEPQKKSWAAPVGGSGTNRGDRSLVSRPEC
jgi:hypothetical protein